jgi:hypothetical protein
MDVCFRGISGHRTGAELGPLMTQSGHSSFSNLAYGLRGGKAFRNDSLWIAIVPEKG